MLDLGKHNVLGVKVDAVDYESAVAEIVEAARRGDPYGATPLAVHGVMTGVLSEHHRHRLNAIELVTPDGQPVRWAMRLLYRRSLPDRVYGPALVNRLLAAAETAGLPVFFFGSTNEVLASLVANARRRHPRLRIAGWKPSRFTGLTPAERDRLVEEIRASGASLTFVGLGCPRQEVFVYEMRERLGMPTVAAGAAFDYLAGTLKEPPERIQRAGLQWLYRLLQDPKRLWRRYLVLNPTYLILLGAQWLRIWIPNSTGRSPTVELRPG